MLPAHSYDLCEPTTHSCCLSGAQELPEKDEANRSPGAARTKLWLTGAQELLAHMWVISPRVENDS